MIELRTLGELAISISGVARRLATDKQAALLVYLAFHQGRALRREHLAGLFWEEADPRLARHSLSQALYQLRARIPELEIHKGRDEISLSANNLRVDALQFRAAAEAEYFQEAANRYQGDFLAGFWVNDARAFEEWQLAQRDDLSRLAKRSMHWLLRAAEAGGDWIKVEQLATRLLKLDPFNEAVHRASIQAIAANEGRRQAIDEYHRVVEFIGAELAREPEPATIALGTMLEEDPTVAESRDESMGEQHWTPFFGRQKEFSRLREEWGVVKAGSGRTVVISGEPGIGKSRLCDHFLRLCAIQGARIFQTRCHTTDRHLPYSAIVGALLGNVREADVAALPAEWASVLSEVLPEFHALLPGLKRNAPLEGEGSRRRLFEGFAQLLQSISARSPLILHIDDFQWCDESSAAQVHYLARRLAGSPVLILASMRPEGEPSHMPPELLAVGEGTSQGYCQITLEPLPYDEVEQIIQAFAERQLVRLPEPLRKEIYARVGGRPFFIIEIIRAISQGQVDWTEDGRGGRSYGQSMIKLPPTVEEFLSRSMRGLGADAEPVVTILAILGTPADPQLVAEVAGLTPGRLLRGLAELSARGLIEESEIDIAFSHDLVREAAYRAMGKSRRRLLHAAVGEALNQREDVPDAVLCTHFDLAGKRDLAYRHAILAADESNRVHGHQETEYFLRIALANAADTESQVMVKERLGTLLLSLSRYSEAESYFTELCAMGEVSKDPRRLLAIRAKLLRITLKQGSMPPAVMVHEITALADDAVQFNEHRIGIDLLKGLVHVGHNTGRRDLVLDTIQHLSILAAQVSDVFYEVTALTLIANVLGIYEDAAAGLDYAEKAVQRASTGGDDLASIAALCSRCLNRTQAGLLLLAEEDFRAALQLIDRLAAESHRHFALNLFGVLLLERGDCSEARAVFTEAVRLTADSAAVQDQVMATGNLLLAEHVSGNQEAAVALAEEVLHLSQRAPFLWCTIGARSILGIYALERGALEAAREYRREILAHAGGRDFWGSDASYAEIFFARLTVQEGDWQAALERLDQAIAAYAERDFFCRSRLQLERARLLLSHDPKAAERQAVEVRRRGREAGARPLIEQANAILDRLSGHSRR